MMAAAESTAEATIAAELTNDLDSITPEAYQPVPLPLAYSTDFDAGFPAELSPNDGWVEGSIESGTA